MQSVSFFTNHVHLHGSESSRIGQGIDVPLEVQIQIVECLATTDLNNLSMVCKQFYKAINSEPLAGERRLRIPFIAEKRRLHQLMASRSKNLAKYGDLDFKLLVWGIQLEIKKKQIQESFAYRFKNAFLARFTYFEPCSDLSTNKLAREMDEADRMKEIIQAKINDLISAPIPTPPAFSAYKKWKWEWIQACEAFIADQLIYDLFGGKARCKEFPLLQGQHIEHAEL